MDSRPFDMLHNSRNQHGRAVGNAVHLKLCSGHIFINQNRIADIARKDYIHKFATLACRADNAHALPADNIGRAQKHRVAEYFSGDKSFVNRIDRNRLRALNTDFFKKRVEFLPVLRGIYSLCRCAEYVYAAFRQEFRQLYCCLPAEGNHNAYGLFNLYNAHNVFLGERLEIQAVGCVIIG